MQIGSVQSFPVNDIASVGGGPPTCIFGVGKVLIGPCRNDEMVDEISAEDV